MSNCNDHHLIEGAVCVNTYDGQVGQQSTGDFSSPQGVNNSSEDEDPGLPTCQLELTKSSLVFFFILKHCLINPLIW